MHCICSHKGPTYRLWNEGVTIAEVYSQEPVIGIAAGHVCLVFGRQKRRLWGSVGMVPCSQQSTSTLTQAVTFGLEQAISRLVWSTGEKRPKSASKRSPGPWWHWPSQSLQWGPGQSLWTGGALLQQERSPTRAGFFLWWPMLESPMALHYHSLHHRDNEIFLSLTLQHWSIFPINIQNYSFFFPSNSLLPIG